MKKDLIFALCGNHTKFYDWFYTNAKEFEKPNQELSQIWAKQIHSEIQKCYLNSWRVLVKDYTDDLRYFEGFLIDHALGDLPFSHAWLVNTNDQVIDPTLEPLGKKLKINAYLSKSYYGMELNKTWVIKTAIKLKRTGDFIFDYYEVNNPV